MGFLTGIEITRRIRSGEIEIYSTDSSEEFNVDTQVTEDSIDLRLAPQALRVKADTIALDYLDPDLATHFEEFEIPRAGYELKPGGVLLTQTLEMIAFPDELVGLVFTRSTFARLGIMVNMGAPKFAAGIHWCFPLQLANLSGYPIVLYPFAPVAQLMISDTVGQPIGYRGRYQDSCHPSPPLVSERERARASELIPPRCRCAHKTCNRACRKVWRRFKGGRTHPTRTSGRTQLEKPGSGGGFRPDRLFGGLS